LHTINIAKVIRAKAATIYKVKRLYEIHPILNEINPVHSPSHFLKIHFNIISHLYVSFPNGLVLSGLRTKILYGSLLSPEQSTCQAHNILLDMLAQITFGEEYRSVSSSLCSFLHSPVTSSLSGPKKLPQHPYLEHPPPMFISHC